MADIFGHLNRLNMSQVVADLWCLHNVIDINAISDLTQESIAEKNDLVLFWTTTMMTVYLLKSYKSQILSVYSNKQYNTQLYSVRFRPDNEPIRAISS